MLRACSYVDRSTSGGGARRAAFVFVLGVVCCASFACGGSGVTPTEPSSSVGVIPAPPSPGSHTLAGRVTESAPTQTTGIPNAIVAIQDGVNGGRTATTDALGFYAIHDLDAANGTITVSADGYVGTSQAVGVRADVTANFELRPMPQTRTHTSTGDIAGSDGRCSDGAVERACRILVIPVHNRGLIEATLTWTSDTPADLNLTLFKTPEKAPIVAASTPGEGAESLRAEVAGGATYELRITHASGTGRALYTLRVDYPD